MSEEKKALLLVAFGTSYGSATGAITSVALRCKSAFPGWEVRLSYASSKIRSVLKEEGRTIPSLPLAMAQLADEEYEEVVVQPLCIIPGGTFRFVAHMCRGFARLRNISGKPLFRKLAIGRPLIASFADCETVLDPVAATYGSYVDHTTALVLVAHGSVHPAGSLYTVLHLLMQERLGKNFFLGALEGFPSFEQVAQGLEALQVQKVVLAPFMLVAGDHAWRDIAGEEANSWKTRFRKRGLEVSVLLKGLGEHEPFTQLFVQRAREAMEGLL